LPAVPAMAESAQDECISRVIASSVAENAAIDMDRAGDVKGAIAKYEESERELAAAIAAAVPSHAEDHPKLVQHRKEVLSRIQHLKSLNGKPATIPVEDQIKAVQLGMAASASASAAVGSAGGIKTLAACAALGAGAGLLVLGSTVGATVAVVGGAAGAAYCATRSDKVGDAARGAGNIALQGVDKAKEINQKHDITGKITVAGTQAITVAKETDQKYGVSTKVSAGVGAAVKRASEFESKHKVTDKVVSGFAAGLGRISAALEKKSTPAASSAAPSQ